ncbi:hypothetical protein, partial [Kingella kingae]|uniref:hypothetical protein n=1 Tax=Kingella kingae TaxID=504 RepID=UPI001E47EA31
ETQKTITNTTVRGMQGAKPNIMLVLDDSGSMTDSQFKRLVEHDNKYCKVPYHNQLLSTVIKLHLGAYCM